MKIGELASRTGVSVRMLRYYEEQGMIRPDRTDSGYRDYGAGEEETVRRIRLLGQAGLTLEAIKAVMPCVRSNQPDFEPCADLRRILSTEVKRLDERLDALKRSRKILAGYLGSVAVN